jgi:replicative DNA helicase
MKNLRGSGAIEQDADVIMFLHRPNPDYRDFLELILEKQRNGPTGDLALHADMAHMRFAVATHIPEGVKSSARTAELDQAWDEYEREGIA